MADDTVDGAFAAAAGAKKCATAAGAPATTATAVYTTFATLDACKGEAEGSTDNLAFQYKAADASAGTDAECTVISGFDAIQASADAEAGYVCHIVKDVTARAAKAKAWNDAAVLSGTKQTSQWEAQNEFQDAEDVA